MRRLNSLHVVVAVGLLALNIFILFFSMRPPRDRIFYNSTSYSYNDEGFPETWPIAELSQVAMTAEDSVHYSVLGPDAREEWASSSPIGYGYLRLGPEHRAFGLTMTHEQHCLRILRAGLENTQTIQPTVIHFCLNYLRQMTLCSPNLTLEPIDIMDFGKVGKKGATHICGDWREVYMELAKNFNNWEMNKKSAESYSG